ncbi:sialic acid synthase isoform X1 [Bactrocera dorsalis]|uniref:Sialic acid synthase isoform X1 n=2 Tax=Bactrocera dorsalis TaxID=27457 RepID=A0A6I9VG42_BACDO|nr:sialic acid synthase isoform X1 [Bactrocera dorsalis]
MMTALKLGNKNIFSDGDTVYIIAEIGQNHQGNFNTAKEMISEAKRIGCDCVKFQKSCLPAKFSETALKRPYISENSFGKTYGEHKEFLEFSETQYRELKIYANSVGIDFTASAMDEISLDFLNELNVPFIKIGSGDANNVLLLRKAAKMDTPLIVSTGMQTSETIEKIVDIMQQSNKTNYALMHCVSSYPTDPDDCFLEMITRLKERYPNIVIGYSGHEKGIEISKAAVLIGARIIERHFTLDNNQRGSDHKCSLEPHEFGSLVNEIKTLEKLRTLNKEQIMDLLGHQKIIELALKEIKLRTILPSEIQCKSKLGKSIVVTKHLEAGNILKICDICIKVSEPNGISAEYFDSVLGKLIAADVNEDSPLTWRHISI